MFFDETDWIWQKKDWTNFVWDNGKIEPKLRHCWKLIGRLVGQSQHISTNQAEQLSILLENILSSSAIEGENLNVHSVYSSLAKRLGVSMEQPYPTSDRSEGVSNIMFDALETWQADLTLERLFQWHRWLFPYENTYSLRIGQLRDDDIMQVVSGRLDNPKVHFQAPPRNRLDAELVVFIQWFNQSRFDATLDPLIRAGICHLWLLTLHPFNDGNGRITRALTDLALAQADQQSVRLYAISNVILQKRKEYYEMLECTQRGDSNITKWLVWFLSILEQAIEQNLAKIDRTLQKTKFWQSHSSSALLASQRKVINRLLDGGEMNFENGINASQYQKVAKVSKATATRHLAELVEKGLLKKTSASGRSTRYIINFEK